MEHVNETVPARWDAYCRALEEAKAALGELDKANGGQSAPTTIEALERLRKTQGAAVYAVDCWRQAAADLYRAAGLAAS